MLDFVRLLLNNKWIKPFWMILFNGGWIYFFYLFGDLISFHLEEEIAQRIAPEIYGTYLLNSFPILPFSNLTLKITCLWLAIVVIVWTIIGFRALERRNG